MNRFSNKVSVSFVNFLSESSYFELVLLRSVLFCFASKNNRFNFTKLISCVQSASLWAKQLIPSCKSILKPRTRFKSSFGSPECNNLLHDISYYLSDGMLHNSGLGRMLQAVAQWAIRAKRCDCSMRPNHAVNRYLRFNFCVPVVQHQNQSFTQQIGWFCVFGGSEFFIRDLIL